MFNQDELPVVLDMFSATTTEYTGSSIEYSFLGLDGSGECNESEVLGSGPGIL